MSDARRTRITALLAIACVEELRKNGLPVSRKLAFQSATRQKPDRQGSAPRTTASRMLHACYAAGEPGTACGGAAYGRAQNNYLSGCFARQEYKQAFNGLHKIDWLHTFYALICTVSAQSAVGWLHI